MNFPKIPLGAWIDVTVEWITVTFADFFTLLTNTIEGLLDILVDIFSLGAPILLILIFALLVTYTSGWPLGIFTLLSLLLIENLGYWPSSIQTIAIVIVSGLITIFIGIPIGIWCSQSNTVQKVVTPFLDFMQTMPAFVYLIPSILFFGIGVVPGIIASFIFSIAPTIRMTNLGIRKVPRDLIEASNAFGSSTAQRLFKIQFPLATPTIMAGVNQSIMLVLSMVVTASLVGAPGLGADVYRAVSQIDVGGGFEAGLSIVFIAIILDRITQNLRNPVYDHIIKKSIVFSALALVIVGAGIFSVVSAENKLKNENPNSIGYQTGFEIIGIEPGAGIMQLTKTALNEYDLENWKITEGSSAGMLAELQKAYKKEQPIIITGWTPHWIFSSLDLKFLEDPKGVFGETELIHTLVRRGLEKELPAAYKILDQFNWETTDIQEVMMYMNNGMSPQAAAEKWIEENSEHVAQWTNGAGMGNGEEINLSYVAWETEIASTNVIAKVLEMQNYKVNLSQVEVGPMFAGVANGSSDAMVAAWLPGTHAEYYNTYKDDLVDLGPNLKGATLGLVVPSYVNIDSIEDLKDDAKID